MISEILSQSHDCRIIFYTYTHDWVITFYEFSMKPSKKWSLHQGSCHGVKFTPHKILCQFFQSFFHLLQPFNETVRVCHNPLVRTCNNDTEGEPICNTYYETVCETSYKSYEVEQDEPICKMELMKKCDNVTSKFSFFLYCEEIPEKRIVMKYCKSPDDEK